MYLLHIFAQLNHVRREHAYVGEVQSYVYQVMIPDQIAHNITKVWKRSGCRASGDEQC